MPVVPASGRLTQGDDLKLKANLGYIMSSRPDNLIKTKKQCQEYRSTGTVPAWPAQGHEFDKNQTKAIKVKQVLILWD